MKYLFVNNFLNEFDYFLCNYRMNQYLDKNFFETIDTEAKAYFLGLMYADGCVVPYVSKSHGKKYNYNTSYFSLGSTDLHIIETFKKILHSENKILIRKAGIKKVHKHYCYCKEFYSLTITNVKICNDLIRHGCVPRKSNILKFPTTVPDRLMHHFIRGLWDGDGSISKIVRKSRQTGKRTGQFVWYVCGTSHICDGINKVFNKDIGFNLKGTNPNKNKTLFRYTKSGNQCCREIHNYIYKNCSSDLCLKRKKIYFDEIWTLIPNKTNGQPNYAFVSKISSTSGSLSEAISKD